jgi:hypothetical protein
VGASGGQNVEMALSQRAQVQFCPSSGQNGTRSRKSGAEVTFCPVSTENRLDFSVESIWRGFATRGAMKRGASEELGVS